MFLKRKQMATKSRTDLATGRINVQRPGGPHVESRAAQRAVNSLDPVA